LPTSYLFIIKHFTKTSLSQAHVKPTSATPFCHFINRPRVPILSHFLHYFKIFFSV